MSKKDVKEVIDYVDPDEEVVADPVEEIVEEKKSNKVLSVAKRLAPFAVLGGIIAVAFAFGKSSGSDVAYLEAIQGDTSADADDPMDELDDGSDREDETEET